MSHFGERYRAEEVPDSDRLRDLHALGRVGGTGVGPQVESGVSLVEPIPYDPEQQGSLGYMDRVEFMEVMGELGASNSEQASYWTGLVKQSSGYAVAHARWETDAYPKERYSTVCEQLAVVGNHTQRRKRLEAAKVEIEARLQGRESGVPAFEGGPLPRPFMVFLDPETGNTTPLTDTNDKLKKRVRIDLDSLLLFFRDYKGEKARKMNDSRQRKLVGVTDHAIMTRGGR